MFCWLIYWLNVAIFLQYVPSNTLGNALEQKCIRKWSPSLNAVEISYRAVKSAPIKTLERSYIHGSQGLYIRIKVKKNCSRVPFVQCADSFCFGLFMYGISKPGYQVKAGIVKWTFHLPYFASLKNALFIIMLMRQFMRKNEITSWYFALTVKTGPEAARYSAQRKRQTI